LSLAVYHIMSRTAGLGQRVAAVFPSNTSSSTKELILYKFIIGYNLALSTEHTSYTAFYGFSELILAINVINLLITAWRLKQSVVDGDAHGIIGEVALAIGFIGRDIVTSALIQAWRFTQWSVSNWGIILCVILVLELTYALACYLLSFFQFGIVSVGLSLLNQIFHFLGICQTILQWPIVDHLVVGIGSIGNVLVCRFLGIPPVQNLPIFSYKSVPIKEFTLLPIPSLSQIRLLKLERRIPFCDVRASVEVHRLCSAPTYDCISYVVRKPSLLRLCIN
jgi:hypothetical protein